MNTNKYKELEESDAVAYIWSYAMAMPHTKTWPEAKEDLLPVIQAQKQKAREEVLETLKRHFSKSGGSTFTKDYILKEIRYTLEVSHD